MDVAELLKFTEDHDLPTDFTVLAHSMGGAISLRAIQGGLKANRAIFSAPMWDIAVNSFGDSAIKVYSKSMGRYFSRKILVPSTSIRNASFVHGYEGNNLTNNKKEHDLRAKQLDDHPELEVGGPSIGWVSEALNDTKKLRAMDLPDIPAICFMGTNENIVSQKAIHQVMSHWNRGELIVFDGAQHELLIENPDVVARVWDKIDQLLSAPV